MTHHSTIDQPSLGQGKSIKLAQSMPQKVGQLTIQLRGPSNILAVWYDNKDKDPTKHTRQGYFYDTGKKQVFAMEPAHVFEAYCPVQRYFSNLGAATFAWKKPDKALQVLTNFRVKAMAPGVHQAWADLKLFMGEFDACCNDNEYKNIGIANPAQLASTVFYWWDNYLRDPDHEMQMRCLVDAGYGSDPNTPVLQVVESKEVVEADPNDVHPNAVAGLLAARMDVGGTLATPLLDFVDSLVHNTYEPVPTTFNRRRSNSMPIMPTSQPLKHKKLQKLKKMEKKAQAIQEEVQALEEKIERAHAKKQKLLAKKQKIEAKIKLVG